MPGPNFLVVELCRDGAEIKKHTVVDARRYGKSRPHPILVVLAWCAVGLGAAGLVAITCDKVRKERYVS
jgi:hypothetical protein